MAEFPELYRKVVQPQLVLYAGCGAYLMRRDGMTFGEAFDRTLKAAVYRGALHLGDDLFSDLQRYLSIKILEFYDKFQDEAEMEAFDRLISGQG